MNSTELRKNFLDFFKKKGHIVLPSSSLVPDETDPSVLFTTAGMHQFKRYYSEPSAAPAARVTTVQKCVRTVDIDEVGDDTHCTFFEMLGNFSFGYAQDRSEKKESYFKKEAIEFAWEFLTQILEIDKKRIYATYFQGERGVAEDQESKKILESIDGLCKIVPQGFDDNFWSLGTENSPGGPTVEFYVDDVEVWNLVFNEYILKAGIYEPAKYKGVDTGMGLERLAVMMQGVKSVYETDLFAPIIDEIKKISGKDYLENKKAFRIIADHIRAAAFMINDGVVPSNKDRGYVLRRLIRRAIVKGQQLGIADDFTAKIAEKVFDIYDGVYFCSVIPATVSLVAPIERSGKAGIQGKEIPDQVRDDKRVELIKAELEKEESKFRQTLKNGLKLLSSYKEIDGEIAFDLYQSFGLPIEITLEEARSQGIEFNNSTIEQFNNLLKEHQEKSRTAAAGMFKGGLAESGEMTTKYHTATHLLLAALRQVVSKDINQRGSNITAERLRFDFNYPEKLTSEQIKVVEDLVNEKIRADLPVDLKEMSYEDAKNCGIKGMFENKYGERVKVYSIDNFSIELCGGPHVTHTGLLGHFKIAKEESSSAGIRRIKAILE